MALLVLMADSSLLRLHPVRLPGQAGGPVQEDDEVDSNWFFQTWERILGLQEILIRFQSRTHCRDLIVFIVLDITAYLSVHLCNSIINLGCIISII